ncbi:MAG: flagellar assembly protein FlaJ [Thaumarchaeota archaeon]|nr:flagellar assembly protein FlaJ [Nitrososphaerota archaeon]MDE1818536.1 flagellar assembly protein FlaJ [Nitrososphaerota archaeon]MDE1875206.1 flagellar assembly protein FlaJ [Nitrososphaerota archaeon]
MMEKLSFKEKLAELKRSDEDLLYFIAFLYALSTGEVGSVEMIKSGQSSGYGRYSNSFKEVFRLGVGWGYGLARSCEMIAAKLKDNADPLKQLLVKLSQVIRLGDELKVFFTDEMAFAIHTFTIRYERNLETQKLFLEMFYTISSTASFMIAANSIMAMLMGNSNSESVFTMSFVGVIVSMGSFIVIMYMIFPKDKLASGKHSKTQKFRMSLFAALGAGISIGIVLTMINVIPLTLVVVVAAAPLFVPGFLARRLETELRGHDEWYPPFIRHFGEIYTMVGSMGQSLDAVLRSNFGPLQTQIVAFKNRVKNRIDPEICFEIFSMEAGTSVIESGNTIMSRALLKGSDMNQVGNKVAEISAKLNELRSKRMQTSRTFETIIIVLHGLTMAIFGLMSTLIEVFHTLLSTVPVSNNAFTLSPIDPNFVHMMLPLVILITSTINALAVKVGQGGLFKTVWFNIAMFTVLGGITMYGTTAALSQFLTQHILDTYSPGGVAAGTLPGIGSGT